MKRRFLFPILFLVASLPLAAYSQNAPKNAPQPKASDEKATKYQKDLLVAQRRDFAASQVMSLANEARSYRDISLRPHVLALAASTLWDADREAARALFHRAWDAAETADADDNANVLPGFPDNPQMKTVARRMRSIFGDSRAEVLRLTAKRDRALAEEFLKKLNEAIKREPGDTKNDSKSQDFSNNWTGDDAASKRLTLARNLLDDDQVDLAVQIAAPALDTVNQKSIDFLSALRAKRPQAADDAFVFLITRAEGDPASDANTVSGLSCYVSLRVHTLRSHLTATPPGVRERLPALLPICHQVFEINSSA